MNKQVVYSIAAPFNEGGMSTIAYHACSALNEASILKLALAQRTRNSKDLKNKCRGLPWAFERTMAALNRYGYHRLKDDFFDRWASCWIEKGDDYYGWLHQSLASIRKCHQGGGRTFVDRGSVEPRHQQCILQAEYKKYGLKSESIHPQSLKRMVTEADETDFIVVPSSLVLQSYMDAGYHPSKIKLNPLGVDSHRFQPPPPESVQTSGKVRLAYIGQLSVQKGIPKLLKSWEKLSPKNAELLMAGVIPTNEKSVIEPLLNGLKNVVWKGHTNSVENLLQTCHALVLPSAQDGFGMVVLEAMACGLPVLVSDMVGARDCIKYSENGWVFCFNKDDALTTHLEFLVKNPEILKGMRQAALDTAKKYTWTDYKHRFIKLFD